MPPRASTSKARVVIAPDAPADEEIISPAEQRRIIEAAMPGLLSGVRPSELRHRATRVDADSLALDDTALDAELLGDDTASDHSSHVEWTDDGPSDLESLPPRQAELLASVLWLMPFIVLFSSLCVPLTSR